MGHCAGVDEAGRGCLVGPVIAAAVILDPKHPITGLADSKKLTARRRETLDREIREQALAWSLGRADPSEIDRLNILQASLLAMRRAILGLRETLDLVRVDGAHVPEVPWRVEACVGGDGSISEISAASIIAKVARDREMSLLDSFIPGYGIAGHKGYPTVTHRHRLHCQGVSDWHRRTFKPVAEVLASAHHDR